MSITIEDVLNYEKAVVNLKEAKKIELELRNAIIKSYNFSEHEGVQHRSLSNEDMSVDISITLKMNRTIDEEVIKDVWHDLTDEERSVISYKPKLNLKDYKLLVKNDKIGRLSRALTEKQGQANVKMSFTDIL